MLGDRLVHLRYFYDDEVSFEVNEELHAGLHWSPELQQTYGSAWRHVVCEEDCPENQEDRKMTTSDGEVLSMQSHFACGSHLYDKPSERDVVNGAWLHYYHETMRLRVLRSCRQIYVEANNILWTTNTFSFDDATTLKRFMMTRTINHKRLIKSLRLQMAWMFCGEKEWNSAINMPLVRSLSGLRRLRLNIQHEMRSESYKSLKECDLLYTTSYFDGLQKLSTLPLTEVDIVFENPKYISEKILWSKVDRQDFAEGLRKILLNPKGAQIYAEDQLEQKEFSRKQREFFAEAKASMFRPLRAKSESTVNPPLAE